VIQPSVSRIAKRWPQALQCLSSCIFHHPFSLYALYALYNERVIFGSYLNHSLISIPYASIFLLKFVQLHLSLSSVWTASCFVSHSKVVGCLVNGDHRQNQTNHFRFRIAIVVVLVPYVWTEAVLDTLLEIGWTRSVVRISVAIYCKIRRSILLSCRRIWIWSTCAIVRSLTRSLSYWLLVWRRVWSWWGIILWCPRSTTCNVVWSWITCRGWSRRCNCGCSILLVRKNAKSTPLIIIILRINGLTNCLLHL